jgi:hypothetical protein
MASLGCPDSGGSAAFGPGFFYRQVNEKLAIAPVPKLKLRNSLNFFLTNFYCFIDLLIY